MKHIAGLLLITLATASISTLTLASEIKQLDYEGFTCSCLILSESLLALIRFFLPTINDSIRRALLTLSDSIIPSAHIQ